MDSQEHSLLLIQDQFSEGGSEGAYTRDGSVDLGGNPCVKNRTGSWIACSFILGTECCERLAYYGLSKNLVTYLTTKLLEGNASAARNVTTWQGTCYLTPLIGAFLADAYWGRYKTIAVFSTIYIFGMVMVTLSASVSPFKPPTCGEVVCPEPSAGQSAMFFISLYLIALGTGGIKPCVSSLGADQFDDTDPMERVKKGSYFNWYYFSINVGALVSGTVIVWIQDNWGWGLGFGIPTLFMGLAIGSFFAGSALYRIQKPGGSPVTRICQIASSCFHKWNVEVPHDSNLLYELPGKTSAIGGRKMEHTSEFKYFFNFPTLLCIFRLFYVWLLCFCYFLGYLRPTSTDFDKYHGNGNVPIRSHFEAQET